jgi:hypothetical protein
MSEKALKKGSENRKVSVFNSYPVKRKLLRDLSTVES